MANEALLPQKRVLALCEVSRATLWRVAQSGGVDFPAPRKKSGRLFWREEDLPAIKAAIAAFEGRTIFDQRRSAQKRKVVTRYAALAGLKQKRRRARTSNQPAPVAPGAPQGDLFDL